ncbi:MAG: MBL fold metallo-hydrolase [Cellvibrionaceae bacterium]|nr:MBL fold metallo-hydrolase [Cellvibrionaceae bacterium]
MEFSGSGRWFQFGQSPAPDTPWPAFDVSSYTAIINFETVSARIFQTRKQIVEPHRERPVPVEQKPDQYVNRDFAWNLAAPQGSAPGTAPVPQPQPLAVEERRTEIWTTPQGFIKVAQAHKASTKNQGDKTLVEFTLGKTPYKGLINSKGHVESVSTLIDNPILGDTPVEVVYRDYKDFGGVQFPSSILKTQGGAPVLNIKISSVKINTPVDFPVPAEISSNPNPAIVVTSTEIAPGVHYLQGGSHHSVAIEQRDYVVVVEAPQHEERSLAVINKIKELIPNKPITHLINSHQHFDHSGGLRTYVDAGATIVTHEGNKSFYEKAWSRPRTLNPDKLAISKKPAKFQTFSDKLVLNDGQRAIEIHSIVHNGHNDAFALVFLPKEKILIEADAFTPPAPNTPPPATVNPFAKNLYENITRLKLDVEHIAPLHGRLVKLDELRSFITVAKAE